MKRKLFLFRALSAVCLVLCLALPVFADGAAVAPTGAAEEFAGLEGLQGAFVTQLPAEDLAVVLLGSRRICQGDVLTAGELQYLTVQPVGDWSGEAAVRLLPVCNGELGEETVLTMHVQRPADGPAAPDQSLETYRGIPSTGTLQAQGEGELTFSLVDAPTRGSVELDADGDFTYTPKGDLVGEDSFTFTVTDAQGRVSEPARVLITIRKSSDSRTFADLDRDRQFTALWMRQSGFTQDEEQDGRLCFYPQRPVSRMDFLVRLMDLCGVTPEVGLTRTGFADESDVPAELRPYLAAALRRGIIRGYASEEGPIFLPNQPIKASEAAMMAARILGQAPGSGSENSTVPAWAGTASGLLQSAGIDSAAADTCLTRQQAADLLYQISKTA